MIVWENKITDIVFKFYSLTTRLQAYLYYKLKLGSGTGQEYVE